MPVEAAAQQPVHSAHRGVERHDHEKLVGAARQDVAGEDLLEVLGALRRAVDQQDRRGRGDDIDDADQRLLRHPSGPGPRAGEKRGGADCEGQRIAVGREPLRGMAEHEPDRRAECGDLGEREIDEDHPPRQHLQAEIRVDADEADGHEERGPEKGEGVGHRGSAAVLSASTSASNSAR